VNQGPGHRVYLPELALLWLETTRAMSAQPAGARVPALVLCMIQQQQGILLLAELAVLVL
jgi:hypothetical protein